MIESPLNDAQNPALGISPTNKITKEYIMYFWEEFGLICSVFGGLLVFFALCIFMLYGAEIIFEQKSCSKSAELYEAETKFHWATGCFIKHNGRFIPMDEYKKLLIPNHQMGNGEIKVSIED